MNDSKLEKGTPTMTPDAIALVMFQGMTIVAILFVGVLLIRIAKGLI